MDDKLNQVFENLDRWRHLPNYQLERRADIFFSVYLRELIANHKDIDTPLLNVIIPEFPLQRGLVVDTSDTSQRSVKVDYLLFSEDRKTIFFVELKTDCSSLNIIQDRYLAETIRVGFPKLLGGLNEIVMGTDSGRKYAHLLRLLLDAGILRVIRDVSQNEQKVVCCEGKTYEIISSEAKIQVVYVQPRESKRKSSIPDVKHIFFADIIKFLAPCHDDFSKRFSASLTEWQQDAGLSFEPCDNERD